MVATIGIFSLDDSGQPDRMVSSGVGQGFENRPTTSIQFHIFFGSASDMPSGWLDAKSADRNSLGG